MGEERRRTNEERVLDELRAGAREVGAEIEARKIPDGELPEGRVRLTFFGEARRVPGHGEKIEVRVADGSWRGGFRAMNGPDAHEDFPDERVVWITSEEEWQTAEREDRRPAGQPWPAAQMRAVGQGA